MKHAAVLALATLAVCPSLARAETAWVGNAFILTATPACGNTAAAGDAQRVIHRPAGAALGNGADSYFAFVGQRANFTMMVPNNTFRAGINYAARYVSSYLNFGTANGAITAWSMSPAVMGAATNSAELTMAITNYYNIVGCNISVRADLERAP